MELKELDEDTQKYFYEMIDEAVLSSDDFPDMKEGFKYIDEVARYRRITFYEMILELYDLDDLISRITDWKKEKGY
jgi:hypothetical protein